MVATTDTMSAGAARLGVICAVGAALAFSLNDMTIKFLSGGYPLHQIVLARSLVALALIVAIAAPLEGGFGVLKTRRPFLHLARGAFVVIANSTFFMSIVAMPLADATAIFFVAPLMITGLSVLMLGERVGPRRWAAVTVGLMGVIVVVRPTAESFQIAALLPIFSAFCYAMLHIFTRRLGVAEKASTMAFYIQITFVIVSGLIGLIAGDGRFDVSDDPSLKFLLGAWVWPTAGDAVFMALLGAFSAIGGYLISQAYRSAEAGLVAPFEYVALVMSIFWGFVVFGEAPDAATWTGVALIIASGVYIALREARVGAKPSAKHAAGRR